MSLKDASPETKKRRFNYCVVFLAAIIVLLAAVS